MTRYAIVNSDNIVINIVVADNSDDAVRGYENCTAIPSDTALVGSTWNGSVFFGPKNIPQQVPMWAVRTVLQNDNLFNQAQAVIAASTDNALKNVWEYGNFADRNSKAIASLAATLNLTDAQVDQMFIDANSLEV